MKPSPRSEKGEALKQSSLVVRGSAPQLPARGMQSSHPEAGGRSGGSDWGRVLRSES